MTIAHSYWHGLVMTEAAQRALVHGAEEQGMTDTERRHLGLAAERKRQARTGRYITIADAEHAVWEIVSNRWK